MDKTVLALALSPKTYSLMLYINHPVTIGVYTAALLNAFMTIWCTDASSLWRVKACKEQWGQHRTVNNLPFPGSRNLCTFLSLEWISVTGLYNKPRVSIEHAKIPVDLQHQDSTQSFKRIRSYLSKMILSASQLSAQKSSKVPTSHKFL